MSGSRARISPIAGERPDSARRDGAPANKEPDLECSTESEGVAAYPGLQVSLLRHPTEAGGVIIRHCSQDIQSMITYLHLNSLNSAAVARIQKPCMKGPAVSVNHHWKPLDIKINNMLWTET